MKKEQLQKILDDISSVRIAVIGDFCLDAYWFIDEAMSEISVETNRLQGLWQNSVIHLVEPAM